MNRKLNLVGASEAAALLGVSKQRFVTRLSQRPNFPKPIAHLRMGRIWHKRHILAWGLSEGEFRKRLAGK
jgi:hypothetical protein